MPAIGFALLWAGYAIGLWGYAKVRGYANAGGDPIGFMELVKPPGYSGPWGKVIGEKAATTPGSTSTPPPLSTPVIPA